MLIPEELHIDAIREAERQYESHHGNKPFDISHWNPLLGFAQVIRPHLGPAPHQNAVEYIYSYELPELARVSERLNLRGAGICITPSATVSQLLVACVLRAAGIRRVHLVAPHYFATSYGLSAVGIDVARWPLVYASGAFQFDSQLDILSPSEEAVWLTDPIFTIGTDLNLANTSVLKAALRSGCWLVADQVLARPGSGLHQMLGLNERTISIHSPHKTICVNGSKFSAIAFDPRFDDAFAHWADVVFGGLNVSNEMAVHHFLSPQFDAAMLAADAFTANTRAFLTDAARGLNSAIWSNGSSGIFGSFLFPRLPSELTDEPPGFWRILDATGTSFISGTRNHMPVDTGFSFRVNIARDTPLFRGAVMRTLKHLESFQP